MDPTQLKALYDYRDNPEFAADNAMRELGYNPGAMNPMLQQMRKSAKGLGTAFQLEKSNVAGLGPTNAANSGADFRHYLMSSMSNGGQGHSSGGGGIYAALERGNQGFGQAVQNVRADRNAQANGGTASVNPYLREVSDQFGALGTGGVGMYGSLISPMMTPRMGGAYAQGLQNSSGSAMNQAIRSGVGNQDIWSYLLGI